MEPGTRRKEPGTILSRGGIRVVIGHASALFREGLASLLKDHEDVKLVGQATSRLEVLRAAETLRPDVLLLEPFIAGFDCLEALPEIQEKSPSTRVILLGGDVDRELIFRALSAGARGYVTQTTATAELVKAIRAVHRGEAWAERRVIGHLLDGLPRFTGGDVANGRRLKSPHLLTERERAVATLVAAGLCNKEIARQLALSEKTIKSHLASIFRKLQISSRLQLAIHTLDWRKAPTEEPDTTPVPRVG